MGSQDRMKERIMKTPTAKDIEPKELKSFLKYYGFELKRSRGSHFVYEYPGNKRSFTITIPMHSPVKPAYIDKIRELIVEIEE